MQVECQCARELFAGTAGFRGWSMRRRHRLRHAGHGAQAGESRGEVGPRNVDSAVEVVLKIFKLFSPSSRPRLCLQQKRACLDPGPGRILEAATATR